jgi:hypothetical protein
MKWQFVITCTIHHTEIPAVPDNWVTNTPSVEMLSIKYCLYLYFHINVSVGLLRIGQVFLSPVKLCIGGL